MIDSMKLDVKTIKQRLIDNREVDFQLKARLDSLDNDMRMSLNQEQARMTVEGEMMKLGKDYDHQI